MKNKIVLTGLALMCVTPLASTSADAAVMMKEDSAIVSGTIMSVDDDIVMLNADNRLFKVDVDDVEMEVDPEKILSAGMVIAVAGEVEDEDDGVVSLDGERLVMVDANTSEDAAMQMLIADQQNED